jgi:hypothetical protein
MMLGGANLMDDLKQTLCEIQDYLAPQLDPWEQMLYHYLFRRTYLEGRDTVIVPARSVGPKIGKGRTGAAELARNNIPKKLRTLEKKGAIKILRKTRSGTEIEVVLPRAILGLVPVPINPAPIDLSGVDFFSSIENRSRIVERDGSTCRYCLRPLDPKQFTIDHIAPQAEGGENSYRNLVAACFECNSRKHSQAAEEFLRGNYRAHLINRAQFDECLRYVRSVQAGELVPR